MSTTPKEEEKCCNKCERVAIGVCENKNCSCHIPQPITSKWEETMEEKMPFTLNRIKERLGEYRFKDLIDFNNKIIASTLHQRDIEWKTELEQLLEKGANGEENNDFDYAQTLHLGIKEIISKMSK